MPRPRRVLVFGAGVIGQIYGGRLAAAGHDVTLLARGDNAERLTTEGVRLERNDGDRCAVLPRVLTAGHSGDHYDVVLVTVRRDQLADALPHLPELSAGLVVFLLNNPLDLDVLRRTLGPGRTVFGFPGVGGYRAPDGTIRYLEIRQQKTTVGRDGGIERPVVELLRSADFSIDLSDDIPAWLKTHALFIAVLGAFILECGGGSAALADDVDRLDSMVAAVGEGFRALARGGVTVTPAGLRILFTRLPRSLAARYWRRQLRGPLGTIAIAPHVSASAETELPALWLDVRRLIGASEGRVPNLRRALDTVQEALP